MNTDFSEQSDRTTGDRAAPQSLTDLFVRQLGQLKRVVAGMGLTAVDAEDVLQDVFVEASKRTDRLNDQEHAARWLIRVTVNRCLMEFRRRKVSQRAARQIRQHQSSEASSASPSPEAAASMKEELTAVREALQELDESLLCPLVLRYFCGLDSTQVGQILQLPASTVRSRLRDARMTLAKRLVERGLEP